MTSGISIRPVRRQVARIVVRVPRVGNLVLRVHGQAERGRRALAGVDSQEVSVAVVPRARNRLSPAIRPRGSLALGGGHAVQLVISNRYRFYTPRYIAVSRELLTAMTYCRLGKA